MKIIGADTQEFLDNNLKIKEYLTVLDNDFSEAGVNKNYVVLTNISIKENETIPCACFYFTFAPSTFTVNQGSYILGDHAEMIEDLSVLIHFANTEPEEIDKILENDTMEARIEVFDRTVYR